MKVCICIPLFTTIEEFQRTYQSILQQDYTDWILFMAVADTLENREQVPQLSDSIILHWFSNQTTKAELLNQLHSIATSDWICYCECGDTWHPKKLGYQVNTFNMVRSKQDSIQVFATQFVQKGCSPVQVSYEGLLCEKDFVNSNKLHLSTLLVYKPAIQFDTSKNHSHCFEYATFFYALLRGIHIYLSRQMLVEVQQRPIQTSPSMQEVFRRVTTTDNDIESATVVTAFYEMPNKWTNNHYKSWLQAFFTNVGCYLVIFTDETTAELFKTWREPFVDRTRVIILPREEWIANKRWGSKLWEDQCSKDPERTSHNPDLYKIWYEKKEFVLKAIEWNPFHHSKFVWCDAGLVRSHETLGWMTQFARADRIPTNQMLLLQIDPFDPTDLEPSEDGIPGNFLRKNRIGGGIQAATMHVWKEWSKRYDAMMQRYIDAGRFIGKDQSIMASMILEQPKSVYCVNPPPGRYRDPLQIWFFLALWLGANDYRFKQCIPSISRL